MATNDLTITSLWLLLVMRFQILLTQLCDCHVIQLSKIYFKLLQMMTNPKLFLSYRSIETLKFKYQLSILTFSYSLFKIAYKFNFCDQISNFYLQNTQYSSVYFAHSAHKNGFDPHPIGKCSLRYYWTSPRSRS